MNIIYKHTCKITGLSYIGKTGTTLEKRLQQHITTSDNSNTEFHSALKEYGIYNFTSELLESEISNHIVNEKEIYYISKFNTFNNGYNMTKGGGLTNHSELTKDKMRKPKTESHKNSMRKPKSEKAKLNMSNAQKGRVITEEHASKISESLTGRTLSQETKDKISKGSKGKTYSKETLAKYKANAQGSKNNAAIKINIFNSNDELQFECNGNFEKTCDENMLPKVALKRTYSNNTTLYEGVRSQNIAIKNKLISFKGWYARRV